MKNIRIVLILIVSAVATLLPSACSNTGQTDTGRNSDRVEMPEDTASWGRNSDQTADPARVGSDTARTVPPGPVP